MCGHQWIGELDAHKLALGERVEGPASSFFWVGGLSNALPFSNLVRSCPSSAKSMK